MTSLSVHHPAQHRAHPHAGEHPGQGAGMGLELVVVAACLPRFSRFRKGNGRIKAWIGKNAGWLTLCGIFLLAMLIAALLGASLIWAILTGVFTMLGLFALGLLALIFFGGDR